MRIHGVRHQRSRSAVDINGSRVPWHCRSTRRDDGLEQNWPAFWRLAHVVLEQVRGGASVAYGGVRDAFW